MRDWYHIYDLQRFAEGAGDGAGDGAEGQTGVTGADAAPQPRRRAKENPLANVRFGIQPDQTTQQGSEEAVRDAAGQEQAQPEETFEQLIKGRFKADYEARMNKVVNGRFREARQNEARMGKMQPIINAIAANYGIDTTDPAAIDLDALLDTVSNDKKLYEEEALREGIPVEMLMQRKQLDRRQAALDAQERAARQESAARQEMNEILTAATALKAVIPDFDIDREMHNPAFARLALKPPRGSGVPLETAYYAVHHAEIEEARRAQQYRSMQSAVQETAQKVANAVASGSKRPSENGAGAAAAALTVTDPATLTKAQRKELRNRVARGEKIVF